MNRIDRPDIQSVLAQMQLMRNAAQESLAAGMHEVDAAAPTATATGPSKTDTQNNFGQMLKDAVGSVNDSQIQAGKLSDAFVKGEEQDLVKVMVSLQKANISFQALTQVRNKVASAYQDIMNMPI